MSAVVFNSSDAWLLQTIFHCDKGNGAGLVDLIAFGDYINRSIFTIDEINSGMRRLMAAELVDVNNERAFCTETAGLFFETLRPKKRSLQKETSLVDLALKKQFPSLAAVSAADFTDKIRFDLAIEKYAR